jgi:hypothetical protein
MKKDKNIGKRGVPAGAIRYSVRSQPTSGGAIREIGITNNYQEAVEWAKKDEALGLNVWVWNLRTGVTVYGKCAVKAQKASA